MYEEITYEVEDRVLTLTLDRPEALNAFTVTMQRELCDAFDRADADDDVRVVIVTGAGRGFCAGADLSMGAATFDTGATAEAVGLREADLVAASGSTSGVPRDFGGLLTLRIFQSTKPVIAAINGPAVGIGATMTLPMDIRLASETAKMGFVFAARGIAPDGASAWFLPRIVGVAQALEWVLTARVFPASEALQGGLVRSLHPPEELLPAAREIAQQIVVNAAPVSAALSRQMLWRMLGAAHPMEAHRIDSRAVYSTGQAADAHEGVMAFLQKRPAEWSLKPSQDLPDWYPWWDEPPFE